jgi:chromosome segregation ATPase
VSDENIIVSVDDAAIDEAIAKLDEALDKTRQLTGQTPEEAQLGKTEQITGQPGETTGFYTIPNSEMDEINARAAETQANVGDAVAESTQKLADLEGETEEAKANVDDVVSESEAKLDEALAKTSQLTGQTATPESGNVFSENKFAGYIAPPPGNYGPLYEEVRNMQPMQVDTSDATVKLDDLEAHAAEAKANVDDVVSESEQKLDGVNVNVEAAKTEVDDVVALEGGEIKGLDSASSRVIRMIPGLREAQRIQRSIGLLTEGSIMGVVGLLLVAYQIYQKISAMLAEQQQLRDEYKKTVMEIRGFTTSAQFTAFQTGQRQAIENSYRPGIIP